MKSVTNEMGMQNEGLAAFVGISAPETPKYLLANNFLLEYFEASGEVEKKYSYEYFLEKETLYAEDDRNSSKLQNSFDSFLRRYLGEEIIRQENRRLNEHKNYYFPMTADMLVSSSATLRHLLLYLQNLDEDFNFKATQELLGDYIFNDDTGINHIMKILLQQSQSGICKKSNAVREHYEQFWSMLTSQERKRMGHLGSRLNEDLGVLLTHKYFRKLDFYRRYNYLATLLTSYVIQYIVARRGANACMLCQGAPRDSRLSGNFHRAVCSNYDDIRNLFSELLTKFYTDAVMRMCDGSSMILMSVEADLIYVNSVEFNSFMEQASNTRRKLRMSSTDIKRAFELEETNSREISVEDFVMRYIDMTGSKKGSSLTKISSTLPTCGRQIDMIFPKNRARQKYFAMSETLTEFYVRLYLARKGLQYDYLDNFIQDLEERYRIVLVKSVTGEKMLKRINIKLPAQEYAKNKAAFIDMLSSINCLIKLSDSGYVITLPEEKGDFKLI